MANLALTSVNNNAALSVQVIVFIEELFGRVSFDNINQFSITEQRESGDFPEK